MLLRVLGRHWKPHRKLTTRVCWTQLPSQTLPEHARYYSKYSRKDKDNDEDVIEAEIINDKTTDNDNKGQPVAMSSWALSNIGNLLTDGFNKAKEAIGMDEKSVQKRQARKRVDAEIDKALRGTGIMGAVLGKFIKIGTHMIVKSAQETSEDLAAVKECTEIVLLNDSRFRKLLLSSTHSNDETVQCVPFSSSLSTVQGQDGKQHKQCSVSMHVLEGDITATAASSAGRPPTPLGTVSVECHLADGSDFSTSSSSSRFNRVHFKSVLFQPQVPGRREGSIWKIDYDTLKNTREIKL